MRGSEDSRSSQSYSRKRASAVANRAPAAVDRLRWIADQLLSVVFVATGLVDRARDHFAVGGEHAVECIRAHPRLADWHLWLWRRRHLRAQGLRWMHAVACRLSPRGLPVGERLGGERLDTHRERRETGHPPTSRCRARKAQCERGGDLRAAFEALRVAHGATAITDRKKPSAATGAARQRFTRLQPRSFASTASTASPIARIRRSQPCVPAIINPTGAVSGAWQGTDSAHPSNKFTIEVLRSMRELMRK